MAGRHESEVAILGAGTIGLVAVFELGLLDLKAHVVDILDRPGGQCTELYPEKPIYDIPGLPVVSGQELTDKLMQQVKPFNPQFHLAEMASGLDKLPDGRWRLKTDVGTEIIAPVVVVAAGAGSFVAQRPPPSGGAEVEGTSGVFSLRPIRTVLRRHIPIPGGAG